MISIIIPVYNSSQYIGRCVASIMSQSYPDWELILIDDGSNDGSGLLCDEYASNGERVKVIHQQNTGASYARKRGIDAAHGEFLTFVDSDDIVENDYLERLYNAMNQYGVKIAACDQIKHLEGTNLDVDKSGEVMLLDDKAIHDRFFKYQFWGLGGKIYHRSVFENLYFPQYTINEDYVVMAQLFDRYKKMAYVPMGLYHYMTHGNSLSHQKLSQRMFDEYYNKLRVRDFYREKHSMYLQQAEAQLTETCVKLIRITNAGDEGKRYAQMARAMQKYLRTHLFSIAVSPYLRAGVKLMAFVNALG